MHRHGLHRYRTRSSGVWLGCRLALAAAGGRQAAAQGAAETPIAPGALTGGGSSGLQLLTLGEDPNRQLVINGFGVLGYDYDFNTGKNSFADSALALSFYKGLSDYLTVRAAHHGAQRALALPGGRRRHQRRRHRHRQPAAALAAVAQLRLQHHGR